MIQATTAPSGPITCRTDKIWGQGRCHSSVDVRTTALPRKVHTHDWGCMGLIFIAFTSPSLKRMSGKRRLLIEGKTELQQRGEDEGVSLGCLLVVSSCCVWIFWHLALFHCYYHPKTTMSSLRTRLATAPDVSFWNNAWIRWSSRFFFKFTLLDFCYSNKRWKVFTLPYTKLEDRILELTVSPSFPSSALTGEGVQSSVCVRSWLHPLGSAPPVTASNAMFWKEPLR